MKGEMAMKVLEVIAGTAEGVGNFIDVFLSAGYGASTGKFNYELSKRERNRGDSAIRRQMFQRYYSLLYRLEQQGLIERKKQSNNVFIRLTHAGKKKLFALKKNKKEHLPIRKYESNTTERKFVIVVFDVPEHSKRKREWLRETLRGLGMKMIQKSVWAGKIKLPRDFLNDLKNYDIVPYVEIFEISKSGSLRQID